MAKHEVIIRENTGVTKTEAPYLPQYVKKTDLAFAALCSQVAAESGLTETQVRAIFEGAFAEFESLEEESAVRIHVDGMTVYLAIYGSFASSDAAFDPLKNTLEIAIALDDDIKYALANVTPTIVTDETATKVRITLVADEEVPRPYEVIHGKHVFEVQGFNLVTTDEGGGVSLENAQGATFACTVVEVISKQKIRVQSATLLEGGDYKLIVKSRGGEAEGPLQAVFRKVKYLKIVDPPTITKIATEGKTGIVKDEAFAIEGTNLAYATGDSVKAKWTEGGVAMEQVLTPASTTAAKMTFAAVSAFETVPDNTTLTFEVTVGSATATATTTLLPLPVIAQTTDGVVKVHSVKDDGVSEPLTYGNDWKMRSSGLSGDLETVGNYQLLDATLKYDPQLDAIPLVFTEQTAGDHTRHLLSVQPQPSEPAAGLYENAEIRLGLMKATGGGESDPVTVTIPVKVLVN